ncbi:MAG: TusE/DsrC/DsvC family sulfur relay protein [Pseudomonadota bacterium]|nr:MAG: TusE/DsrC/DsvC family sulfur relay protein [Pseudomonadota bacterium]
MADISKYIVNPGDELADPKGYLLDLDEWSEEVAIRRAVADGVKLTNQHWAVLRFLREYYAQHGPGEHAREISKALEARFAREGGRKHLYTLFPKGPVNQASRFAGLPVPADATDPSFGSTR